MPNRVIKLKVKKLTFLPCPIFSAASLMLSLGAAMGRRKQSLKGKNIRVKSLTKLQAETETELAAFAPVLLVKAFRRV